MDRIIEIPRSSGGASRIVMGGADALLGSCLPQGRVIVVTDENVLSHYRPLAERYEYIVTGGGEERKTLAAVEGVYRALIEMEAGRDCFILGLGGGVVTDVAGFAASTYMRGVRFGFVPTTLLAQVDAAIGGKNGVNVGGYKNMAGTFSQPEFVLCDTSFLATLPQRETRSGAAEAIKAGVIGDAELFSFFEGRTLTELLSDGGLLTDAVERAIRVKASIVAADEKEAGERRKLNLGHTFAHAIEKVSADYTHGEAVAAGMVMACGVAEGLGLLRAEDGWRIRRAISGVGLPTEVDIDRTLLADAIAKDKKRVGGEIMLVLPTAIGDCTVRAVPVDEVGRWLVWG